MQKDFDEWNKSKKIIHENGENKLYHTRIPIGEVQNEKASVIISQIKVVDTKRLIYKIGFLDKDIFINITKTIKDLF